MARKLPVDRLNDTLAGILNEYADDVSNNVGKIAERMGKAGVSALRSESKAKFKGTGRYASGWKADVEKGRLNTKVTIYNANEPGLPHLLEHGHAKRGGGRVAGREHIAPVERELAETFEREVTEKL